MGDLKLKLHDKRLDICKAELEFELGRASLIRV